MEHTDEQRGGEDTTTQRLGEPKDVADGHGCCCLIALRIQHKATAPCELGPPFEEDRSEDCSALEAARIGG
jgi:hypothetical protein